MHRSAKYVRVVFFCLVVLGVSLPAAAQDEARVELSGGYNFIRHFDPEEGGEDENVPGGWYADVAGNLTSMLAIVGQVNGNYKELEDGDSDSPPDLKVHGFLGGVRVRRRVNERAVPFGQVLVGGTNIKISFDDFDESETLFTVQLGGGVNLMATERVGIRVGVDYLRVLGKEDSKLELEDDSNVFRFVAGVVLPLGQR